MIRIQGPKLISQIQRIQVKVTLGLKPEGSIFSFIGKIDNLHWSASVDMR